MAAHRNGPSDRHSVHRIQNCTLGDIQSQHVYYATTPGRIECTEIQTIVIYDPGCLTVCMSRAFAVQTRLNGSRSCLSLEDPGNMVLDGSPALPHTFYAAFPKLLPLLVSFLQRLHLQLCINQLQWTQEQLNYWNAFCDLRLWSTMSFSRSKRQRKAHVTLL